MSQTSSTAQTNNESILQNKKSYQEIVAYLNANWYQSPLSNIQKLNVALKNPAEKIPSIIIAGTNGKTSTIYYATVLFQQKHINSGALIFPHFETYNEHIQINNQKISNQDFTLLANQIFYVAHDLQLQVSTKDILTSMAFLYFVQNNLDVILLELNDFNTSDPISICSPSIVAIPRVIKSPTQTVSDIVSKIMTIVRPTTYVISADQSKISLQLMAETTKQLHGNWIMPIRKTAALPYPFEQLFGRNAALADRLVYIYMKYFYNKTVQHSSESLNQGHNLAQDFWKSYQHNIPYRFQMISTNTKTVILDTAHNIDALENLFLGIRLLNYQQAFNSITFIFDIAQIQCNEESFIKLFRSCFKKFLGIIAICNIKNMVPVAQQKVWNINTLCNLAEQAKIKLISYSNLDAAISELSKNTQTKQDLLVIAGSTNIITQYLKTSSIEI